jgi:acyl-CoA thioesterase-1
MHLIRTAVAATLAAALPVGLASAQDTNTSLPHVLIIGDSISNGYTPPVAGILSGVAIVAHNPGNAQHSAFGLKNLDEWLGETKWAVIHFNHGLHDLKYVDAAGKNTKDKATGHIQIPVDEYEKNLDAISARLMKTGAKLIFATTTPYPDRPGGPLRESKDLPPYNSAARRVMKKHRIPINDLHAFVLPRLAELQQPNNVHFTKEGSKALGEEVAKHIRAALKKRR